MDDLSGRFNRHKRNHNKRVNCKRYLSPLKGLNTASVYISNRAETLHTARKHRIAVTLLKLKNSSRLKPEKAYTPPHMPRIIKFTVQIIQVKRIQKVCAKFLVLYALLKICRGAVGMIYARINLNNYIFKNKLFKVHAFGKIAG